jgi:uncharacterized membrane protein YccC
MPSLQLGPVRNSVLVREALRIAPVRPDLIAGLRAGLSTTLPLLLGSIIARPELAWAGLSGFSTVLVDKGGAYRTRAYNMLALALVSALVIPLGMLAAEHTLVAVSLVWIVVAVGAFLRLFGAEATSIGISMSVTLIVALVRPAHDAYEALWCGLFSLLGSAWSAVLSLLLWPLRPYHPARLAIARAVRALAAVATSFVDAHSAADAQRARRARLSAARQAIESARAAVAASRRSRPGPTRAGEQLVALLEAADQLFAALVALEDGLSHETPSVLPNLPHWIDREGRLIAAQLGQVALALEQQRAPNTDGAAQDLEALRRAIAPAQAEGYYVPRILSRTLERLEGLSDIARGLDPSQPPSRASRTEPSELSTGASKLSLLRDNLTLDSALCRHALRVSITTASVVWIVHAWSLPHGYWATLTCLVIMQPHGAATWTKAAQRVLGTLLGAVLATLVASWMQIPWLVALCVFGFVAIGIALLPLNYGAYAVFLTPGFVLLAETHAGGENLASVRVLNTLLGAVIALACSRLLFPVSERDQIRPLMAAALRELGMLLEIAASEQPKAAALAAARRGTGMALINAEASYQRLITETGVSEVESEALLSLLLYVHRLASGLIALAVAEGTSAHRSLRERSGHLAAALEELATSVAQHTDPDPIDEGSQPEEASQRVERLFDQLAVLRSAILRWHGHARDA